MWLQKRGESADEEDLQAIEAEYEKVKKENEELENIIRLD